MPTKIVRLTENDLMRLVKRVLEEQTQPDTKKIENCFITNFESPNLKVPQSCIKMANKVIKNKTLPSPADGMACGSEIMAQVSNVDIFSLFEKMKNTADCLMKTVGNQSPVMY